MITLHDLVQTLILSPSDHLCFRYKNYLFSCQVDKHGVMYNFQANSRRIFCDRLPFDSISTWADSCIQQIAKEYVTRFSSWKRVRHLESGLCMNSLRQMYAQFAIPKAPITANSIASLRQYISALSHYCRQLEDSVDHWQRFQSGQERRPPEKILYKPCSVQQIMSLQQQYQNEKWNTERAAKRLKKATVSSAFPIMQTNNVNSIAH